MSHPKNKEFEIGLYFRLNEEPVPNRFGELEKAYWKGTWQEAQDVAEDWAKEQDDQIDHIEWGPVHYGTCYDEYDNILGVCIYIDEI